MMTAVGADPQRGSQVVPPRQHQCRGPGLLGLHQQPARKRIDSYIRRLLISGAHVVLRYAKQGRPGTPGWAAGLL
jgi:hypothetical protein